jgi:recombination protein RecA
MSETKEPVDEGKTEDSFLDKVSKEKIEEKLIKLKPFIRELDQKYSPEGVKTTKSIMDVASKPFWYNVEKIPSGVFSFDVATGGGIPIGKMTEFFGNESSSKTTMALRVCGQAQKKGMLPVFVDVEGTLDEKWAGRFCDTDHLLLTRPESGEEALEIVDGLIRSGSSDLIVVDSIAAMAPTAEIKKTFSDATVGELARLVNKAMRKWVSSMQFSVRNFSKPVTLLYIQQLRMKIGIMFGNPETIPGGMAQKFAKSLSVKMWHGKIILDESEVPSMVDMNFKIDKSKVSPVGFAGVYTMMLKDSKYKKLGEIWDEKQLRLLAIKYGFIEKDKKDYGIVNEKGEIIAGITKLEDIDTLFLEKPAIAEIYRKELKDFLISL